LFGFLGFEKSNPLLGYFCFIMGSMSRSAVYLGIMAMVLFSVCGPARGADSSGDNTCISGIIPCQSSLNTTGRPPNSCCTPLVKVYNTDKACLCGLLNDTALIKQFNVNVTEALQLPVRCGLNANISSCSDLGTTTNSSTTPSPGSSSSPSTNNSALSSLSSFEIFSLLALLLLGVAAQVYQ